MVVVENSDWLWKGICHDGYLPKEEELKKACQIRGVKDHGLNREQMMSKLLDGRYESAKSNKEVKKCGGFCDLFILRSKQSNPVHEGYDDLKEESGADKRPDDYCQLIFIADNCQYVKQCTSDMVRRTGFEHKNESQYKNISGFAESCNNLLDDMISAYVAPCTVVEERLRKHFECHIE